MALQFIVNDNYMSDYMELEGAVNATDKPIGFWLKHLHNLIESQFESVLADLGIGRRHWQALNVLRSGTHTRAEIENALAPFWQDTAFGLDALLDGPEGLVTRGWARYEAADSGIALTERGRTTHAAAAAHIGEARGVLLRGLAPEQYAETVRILSVMAGNIEAALSGSPVTPGVPAA